MSKVALNPHFKARIQKSILICTVFAKLNCLKVKELSLAETTAETESTLETIVTNQLQCFHVCKIYFQ